MKLLFLHGPAACGKLTVATEVAARTGFRLFHNHLTVDLVAALFDFGSEPFVRLRETIWLAAFREAALADTSLVFTFQPEASVGASFPEQVVECVTSSGGSVIFVALTCPENEIERRVENASRRDFGKLRSLAQYRSLRDAGAFDYPPLPPPALALDTHALSPEEAAERIVALVDADRV